MELAIARQQPNSEDDQAHHDKEHSTDGWKRRNHQPTHEENRPDYQLHDRVEFHGQELDDTQRHSCYESHGKMNDSECIGCERREVCQTDEAWRERKDYDG